MDQTSSNPDKRAPDAIAEPVAQQPEALEPTRFELLDDAAQIPGPGDRPAGYEASSVANFAQLNNGPHKVARTKLHKDLAPLVARARLDGKPARFPVEPKYARWKVDFAGYHPPKVDEQDPKWNPDPRDPRLAGPFTTLEPVQIEIDEKTGAPLNFWGRTGIQGRGFLAKWGANMAVDRVITRHDPETERLQALLVERGDTDTSAPGPGQAAQQTEWALPGGWIEANETAPEAAAREQKEETGFKGVKLGLDRMRKTYEGYSDDPRNTDNAWMETTAFHTHLELDEALAVTIGEGPQQGDAAPGEAAEIKKVQWVDITEDLFDNMFASHHLILAHATKELPRTAGEAGNRSA